MRIRPAPLRTVRPPGMGVVCDCAGNGFRGDRTSRKPRLQAVRTGLATGAPLTEGAGNAGGNRSDDRATWWRSGGCRIQVAGVRKIAARCRIAGAGCVTDAPAIVCLKRYSEVCVRWGIRVGHRRPRREGEERGGSRLKRDPASRIPWGSGSAGACCARATVGCAGGPASSEGKVRGREQGESRRGPGRPGSRRAEGQMLRTPSDTTSSTSIVSTV